MSKDNTQQPPPLSDFRPYLFRATYAWLSDNNETPQIAVDARWPGVKVPQMSVKNGMIILNISMSATGQLEMRDTHISFNARFGGRSVPIYVPFGAIRHIYGRESGVGAAFPEESAMNEAPPPDPAEKEPALRPVETALPGAETTEGAVDEMVDHAAERAEDRPARQAWVPRVVK